MVEDAPNPKNLILTGIFFIRDSSRILLQLTRESISWENEAVSKSVTTIPLQQLVAVTLCDCSSSKQSKSTQCYYCRLQQYYVSESMSELSAPDAKSMKLHYAVPYGKHSWKLKSLAFVPGEHIKLKNWTDAIQDALAGLNRPKKLLIFINPFGGKKKGMKIYEKRVSPLLHLAGIESHVIVTERANHGKDLIQEININKYDGIISVGGDGMFSEILNSVVLKAQGENKVNADDLYASLAVPNVPIGIIPAGSTNSAANCITGSCDPICATLLIIMGDQVNIDVCGVYNAGHVIRFGVTFLSYGFFGDVIRDSEKFRWMGPKRYDFSGLKKLLRRRLYEGEIHLKVSIPSDRSLWEHGQCRVGCDICLNSEESNTYGDSIEKLRWMTVQGRFIAVNTAIMSCACDMSPKGMSPSQHLGNGFCDLILVNSCSRFNYLRYLLRTSYHHQNPFDLNFVQVYRVNQFIFSPYISEDKTPAVSCGGVQSNVQQLNSSVWDCDGEVINEPAVHVRMHQQLVRVFGRGYEERRTNSPFSDCFWFNKND